MGEPLLIQNVTARSHNGIVMRWVMTADGQTTHLLPPDEPAEGDTFCGRKANWTRPILDDTWVCISCAHLGAEFIRIILSPRN